MGSGSGTAGRGDSGATPGQTQPEQAGAARDAETSDPAASRRTHRSEPRVGADPELDLLSLAPLVQGDRSAGSVAIGVLRQQADQSLQAGRALQAPEGRRTARHEHVIEIPGPAGPMRARVFAPGPPDRGTHPALLYFHGGGFLFGSPEAYGHVAASLCMDAEVVVASVAYRLAPDHPFPAALDDGVAAFRWLRQNARKLGCDPRRVAIGGNSAGGNVAVAVSLRLRDARDTGPRALALICPWLDLTLESESFRRLGPRDPLVNQVLVEVMRTAYAPNAHFEDPLLSPVFADLRGLPETLVVAGEADPLCSDGVTFAERLRRAGGRAELRRYPGAAHEFVSIPESEAGVAALADVASFLRRTLLPRSRRRSRARAPRASG